MILGSVPKIEDSAVSPPFFFVLGGISFILLATRSFYTDCEDSESYGKWTIGGNRRSHVDLWLLMEQQYSKINLILHSSTAETTFEKKKKRILFDGVFMHNLTLSLCHPDSFVLRFRGHKLTGVLKSVWLWCGFK